MGYFGKRYAFSLAFIFFLIIFSFSLAIEQINIKSVFCSSEGAVQEPDVPEFFIKNWLWTDCDNFTVEIILKTDQKDFYPYDFQIIIENTTAEILGLISDKVSIEEISDDAYRILLSIEYSVQNFLDFYPETPDRRYNYETAVTWSSAVSLDYDRLFSGSFFALRVRWKNIESQRLSLIIVKPCPHISSCEENEITQVVNNIKAKCIGTCDTELEKVMTVAKFLREGALNWLVDKDPTGFRYFRINEVSEAAAICRPQSMCDIINYGYGTGEDWINLTKEILVALGIDVNRGWISIGDGTRTVLKIRNRDNSFRYCGVSGPDGLYYLDPFYIILTGDGKFGNCSISQVIPDIKAVSPTPEPTPFIDNPFSSPTVAIRPSISVSAIPETDCDDFIDNDFDRLLDCQDPDCKETPACQIERECFDAYDNDDDGLIDCEDPDCEFAANCLPENLCYLASGSLSQLCCQNNIDDDYDGYIDCDDHDCLLNDRACILQENRERAYKSEIISSLYSRWDNQLSIDYNGCVKGDEHIDEQPIVSLKIEYDPYSGEQGVFRIDYSISDEAGLYNTLLFTIKSLGGDAMICTEDYEDRRCESPCQ